MHEPAGVRVAAERRAVGVGDPGRLRAQLAAKAEDIGMGDAVAISPEEIERGIAIDFGKHVAAVWRDNEPLGTLGGEDLVMHHLGGLPEIVTLEELAETRPRFSLRVPKGSPPCRVKLAGDVVLAGEDPWVVEGFGRGDADLLIANLEGVPTQKAARAGLAYDFTFPQERLERLVEAGVSVVSLANNHALDAGEEGLLEGMRALEKAGIPWVGAGADEAAACEPWRVEAGGGRFAVFGASIVGDGAAGPDLPGIAMLPRHGEWLDAEIRKARAEGARVIFLLHGGDEYRVETNDEQRHWARWLAARGVSVVAGAHPHVVQRRETHGGTVIFHSLGNAIYPRTLAGAASGRVEVVEMADH